MKNYSIFDKIKRVKTVSLILSLTSPGYSRCEKCGLPWNFCKHKTVPYNNTCSTFATCDYCLDNSKLEQLKIYYTRVYRQQEKSLQSYGHAMDHTLKEMLDAVENEYYKGLPNSQKIKDIRKTKLNKIFYYE
jgi:hypothetical protein